MAHTTSLSFPNMINVAQNTVSVIEDNASIANRVRLLILTEPTELYNSPTFGVGLRRYVFQYNNSNSVAMIQDRIKKQLRIFEPCVDVDNTQFADGLLYTGSDTDNIHDHNHLKMTVKLETKYADSVSVSLNESIQEGMYNE